MTCPFRLTLTHGTGLALAAWFLHGKPTRDNVIGVRVEKINRLVRAARTTHTPQEPVAAEPERSY